MPIKTEQAKETKTAIIPLSAAEADLLSVLLTKSAMVRSAGIDPAHITKMGILRERASAAGQKITEQTCSRCKRVYMSVEGSTLGGCHHCCQGRMG